MTYLKNCPYCGEEVKQEAIKCKHCKAMLSNEDGDMVAAAAPARPQQAAPKAKKSIWKRWWVWVIVGLLVIGMFGGGNGNDEEVVGEPEEAAAPEEVAVVEEELPITYETQKPKDDVAWKLAVIKTGNSSLPFDDPVVNLFAFYLDRIDEKTTQNRVEIGDMTVKVWQILREEVNPLEDLLFVIRELNNSIPDDMGFQMNLAEIGAAYIILRQAE